MKKPLILGMTTMLALGSLSGTLTPSAHANENTPNEVSETVEGSVLTEEVSNPVTEVGPYVHKDEQGFLYIDKNIPEDVYIENNVQELEEKFAEINAQVENGQVTVNDDLSITSNMMTTFASKGYTSKTFWWGERATYTNAQTKSAVKSINSAAVNIGFGGAMAFFLPLASVPAGVTAAYLYKVGNSMTNANKGRGVILDMTWALVYKTKSR